MELNKNILHFGNSQLIIFFIMSKVNTFPRLLFVVIFAFNLNKHNEINPGSNNISLEALCHIHILSKVLAFSLEDYVLLTRLHFKPPAYFIQLQIPEGILCHYIWF